MLDVDMNSQLVAVVVGEFAVRTRVPPGMLVNLLLVLPQGPLVGRPMPAQVTQLTFIHRVLAVDVVLVRQQLTLRLEDAGTLFAEIAHLAVHHPLVGLEVVARVECLATLFARRLCLSGRTVAQVVAERGPGGENSATSFALNFVLPVHTLVRQKNLFGAKLFVANITLMLFKVCFGRLGLSRACSWVFSSLVRC